MPKHDLPWNPWRLLDEQRARTFSEAGTWRLEVAMIRQSYARVADPVPCPREGCTERPFGREQQSKAHWRVTVGAHQCPNCRAMVTADGRVILDSAGVTPEWSA